MRACLQKRRVHEMRIFQQEKKVLPFQLRGDRLGVGMNGNPEQKCRDCIHGEKVGILSNPVCRLRQTLVCLEQNARFFCAKDFPLGKAESEAELRRWEVEDELIVNGEDFVRKSLYRFYSEEEINEAVKRLEAKND